MEYYIYPIIGAVAIGVIILIAKLVGSSAKIEKARSQIKHGDYKSAEKILKKMINRDPADSKAYFYLGIAYKQQKMYEWAINQLKKVVALQKFDIELQEPKIREELASLYLLLGRKKEAKQELLLNINENPDDYQSLYKLGEIFLSSNDYKRAIHYLEKAYKNNPIHSGVLELLGISYFEARNYKESKGYLDKVATKDPTNYKAFFYLGRIYEHFHKYKEAIQAYDKAMLSSEYRLQSMLQKGFCLKEMKDFANALHTLEIAEKNIKVNNSLVGLSIRYNLAQIYEEKKDIISAIKQWENIMKAKSDYKDVALKLSYYEDLRGNDKLKDFFTASKDEFTDLCKKIITSINHSISTITFSKGVLCEAEIIETVGEWVSSKRIKKFLRIYRQSEPITDKDIKTLVEKVKTGGFDTGICMTISSFTKLALDIAKENEIKIYDKNKFSQIINKI